MAPAGPGPALPASEAAPVYHRPSQARMALGFSVLGLFCCGLPSMVGALMAAIELRAIGRGITDPTDVGAARGALLLGLLATMLWLLAIALWTVAAMASMGGVA